MLLEHDHRLALVLCSRRAWCSPQACTVWQVPHGAEYCPGHLLDKELVMSTCDMREHASLPVHRR